MEYKAVTRITSKSPETVFSLGGSLQNNITAHADVFKSPNPTMEILGGHLSDLNVAIKAKDGSKLRNQVIRDCTDVVFSDITELKLYVNTVAKGDRSIILMSGFDSNSEPVKHDIPGKAIIKRIEDGSKVNSAKIYIESLPDADRYKVEGSTSLQNPAWTTLLDIGSSNKLELSDMERGEEIFLRVWGGNTHGWGLPSEPMAFIPR